MVAFYGIYIKLFLFFCTKNKLTHRKTFFRFKNIRHESWGWNPWRSSELSLARCCQRTWGWEKIGTSMGSTCEEVRLSFTRDFLLRKLSFSGKQQVDFLFGFAYTSFRFFWLNMFFLFFLRFLKCRFLGRHENRELQQTHLLWETTLPPRMASIIMKDRVMLTPLLQICHKMQWLNEITSS